MSKLTNIFKMYRYPVYIKNYKGNISKKTQLINLFNNDKSLSKTDKGWIYQEIKRGKNVRNPPGKDLAHERGREKAKGYGYEHTKLQLISNHRIQHRLDNMGKNNKERRKQPN